ncbi:hypothetical protein CAL27_01685 [Bordetella genomosp. 1]|uniref:DUF1007 family protein n=2 Tax=Bordetella genomosp. 1 TaxID=1395607 RepID=A0ABX4F382_9BORD|nr:hypothetical protein CAL27_01685 [Bordetella genomosp. 1]
MERGATRRSLAALSGACAAAALTMAAAPAQAHPHMWIDAQATVVFDAQGRLAAVRETWLFDEMFGTYATQGLKKQADGSLPPDVLRGMADDWMKALGEPISHYFTRVTFNGAMQTYAAPKDARVVWKDGRLALSFELPLATPRAVGAGGAQIDIYDPTYFVAYAFDAPGAIRLDGAPSGCTQRYQKPRELDWQTMQQLAAIPADPEALPDELYAITKGLTHRIEVTCK